MSDQALTEQLNGLINLLQAVGIDSVDNREVKKASLALKNQGSGAPFVFPPDIPEAKQLNDAQVEAMILKLQQAQAQAPQLLEAMEDYIGQQNGTVSSRGKKKGKKKKAKKAATPSRLAPPPRDGPSNTQNLYQPPPDEYIEEVVEDYPPPQNDHDDYVEEEDDDSFDEDADYPMVGHGISDDVSIMSDMTTPTVVSSLHVLEEEQYNDMLPSMYVAGSGVMVQPPKRKNLVSQVGRNAAGAGVPMRVGAAHGPAGHHQGHAGGAAAKRRQTYNQTMSRLHQNPRGTTAAGPAALAPVAEGGLGQSYHSNEEPGGFANFSQQTEGDNNAATKTKKKATKGTKKAAGMGSGSGRNHSPKPKKKKAVAAGASTTIDKSGFLVDGNGAAVAKPKKSKDQLSESAHSDGTGIKKKKKIVKKKPSGEGAAVGTRPKKKVAPRT